MTDHDLHHRPTRLLAAATGVLVLALAACGSEQAKPTTVSAQAESTAAAAQQGGTAAAAPVATAAAASQPVDEHLSTNCPGASDGRVYFSVGGAVFAVPGGDVRTVIPPDVTPQTPAEQVVQKLRASTAQGAGCPGKPLPAALLGVAGPKNDPLLADAIALVHSQPGAISTPFSRLTKEMLANREKCRKPSQGGEGLIACPATEQDGAKQVQSLYLVSTDPKLKLSFGGALAARCLVADNQIRGCEIVDELPGGVGVRMPLRALPQSAAALAAAHRNAIALVKSERR